MVSGLFVICSPDSLDGMAGCAMFPTDEPGVFCTVCCHSCVPAFTLRMLGDGVGLLPLAKFGTNRCDGDALVGVITPGLWTLWSDPEPALTPELFGR